MKKLFQKNGDYRDAHDSEDHEGRYISLYENNRLLYSIFSGKSAMRQVLILADGITELNLWEVQLIAEIYKNFDQYYNNLLHQHWGHFKDE
jgi:hypothetical protein